MALTMESWGTPRPYKPRAKEALVPKKQPLGNKEIPNLSLAVVARTASTRHSLWGVTNIRVRTMKFHANKPRPKNHSSIRMKINRT